MQSRHFEVVIAGQGIAGTVLAWTLHLRGVSVCIIDPQEASTASRVAAGLMTPITGPKLALSWEWQRCRPLAEDFYREVEECTGDCLFTTEPAVHLLRSADEQKRLTLRRESIETAALIRPMTKRIDDHVLSTAWGGFEMPDAARLHVSRFLDVSRDEFNQRGAFIQGHLDPASDPVLESDSILLPRWNLRTQRLLFCQGYPGRTHPCFGCIRFNPAKGEILSLKIPQLTEYRRVHSGMWLVQDQQDQFLAGATFEWKQLDSIPTPQARQQLLKQLSTFLKVPVEVTGQRAAVRPTMHDFKPVIGLHPECRRIGIMNGMGTKGSLMAPWLARLLADHIQLGTEIPPELDVVRWFR